MNKNSQHIPEIRIADYDYKLPDEQIARHPLPRGEARLLIYDGHNIDESNYRFLPDVLSANAHLIFNETRVVQARLLFPKNEQTTIEVFCLEPAEALSVEEAMQKKERIQFKCLVGGARKWKNHDLQISLDEGTLTARKLDREAKLFIIEFSWNIDLSFGELIDKLGKTPLPPYLKRPAEESDRENYQTVFARRSGSVAAPTAGLHFNEEILAGLHKKGVSDSKLTLHVGAGTFRPVSADSVVEHHMHAEEVLISDQFLENTLTGLKQGRSIIPVGTTSLRALESAYWAAHLIRDKRFSEKIVPQWVGFEPDMVRMEAIEALECLQVYLRKQRQDWLSFKTALIIMPGYEHRIIDGLITNFHQPKSTLLLLVASLVGSDWKKIYDYALRENFRFLSYGDGCLIMRKH